MPVGIAVSRLNGLAPLTDDLEVGAFQLVDLADHIDQIRFGSEPAKDTVGHVQVFQGFLVPALRLIKDGQFAQSLSLFEREMPLGGEV